MTTPASHESRQHEKGWLLRGGELQIAESPITTIHPTWYEANEKRHRCRGGFDVPQVREKVPNAWYLHGPTLHMLHIWTNCTCSGTKSATVLKSRSSLLMKLHESMHSRGQLCGTKRTRDCGSECWWLQEGKQAQSNRGTIPILFVHLFYWLPALLHEKRSSCRALSPVVHSLTPAWQRGPCQDWLP